MESKVSVPKRHVLPKEKRIKGDGLVLSRKQYESITIIDSAGIPIVITVASGSRCSLHINAPRNISVRRTENIDEAQS